MSVYWDAEGQAGARGYYLSPDPRFVIFFNDVSCQIRMSNREDVSGPHGRPMTRAVFVPAGVPLWTKFTSAHSFSHLDLHLHQDRLLRFLSPTVGGSAARTIIRRPVEIQDLGGAEILAGLLVREVSMPSRHGVYAENLAGSIATALLDIPAESAEAGTGRLTQAQINKLTMCLNSRTDGRLSVAEMAEIVGLSESWFTNVFKQTTGKTPLQWQLAARVERAKNLLSQSDLSVADIAAQLSFSDQAHLTKAFRQVAGETPAAWRRLHRTR
ncbi:AraC-like DNA-binding protein [Pseudorhizobium tarimense]|uniref:AraC-like DNA-binding protein n=2 Tax=Pseudorhizobium tarimense TaxID=1079109 RepID=A0ABV2H159_9HYPH